LVEPWPFPSRLTMGVRLRKRRVSFAFIGRHPLCDPSLRVFFVGRKGSAINSRNPRDQLDAPWPNLTRFKWPRWRTLLDDFASPRRVRKAFPFLGNFCGLEPTFNWIEITWMAKIDVGISSYGTLPISGLTGNLSWEIFCFRSGKAPKDNKVYPPRARLKTVHFHHLVGSLSKILRLVLENTTSPPFPDALTGFSLGVLFLRTEFCPFRPDYFPQRATFGVFAPYVSKVGCPFPVAMSLCEDFLPDAEGAPPPSANFHRLGGYSFSKRSPCMGSVSALRAGTFQAMFGGDENPRSPPARISFLSLSLSPIFRG